MKKKHHDLSDFSVGDMIIVNHISPTISKHAGKKTVVLSVGKMKLTVKFQQKIQRQICVLLSGTD